MDNRIRPGKDILVHKDIFGNTLWSKDKGFSVMYGLNADGVVLCQSDFRYLFLLAKRQGKLKGVSQYDFLNEKIK